MGVGRVLTDMTGGPDHSPGARSDRPRPGPDTARPWISISRAPGGFRHDEEGARAVLGPVA